MAENFYALYLILQKDIIELLFLLQDQLKYNDYEVNDTHLWNYIVAMDKINLNAGRYIMKPYFLILDNSPENTSDFYSSEFEKNYLNIPSDIKSDTLYIE